MNEILKKVILDKGAMINFKTIALKEITDMAINYIVLLSIFMNNDENPILNLLLSGSK